MEKTRALTEKMDPKIEVKHYDLFSHVITYIDSGEKKKARWDGDYFVDSDNNEIDEKTNSVLVVHCINELSNFGRLLQAAGSQTLDDAIKQIEKLERDNQTKSEEFEKLRKDYAALKEIPEIPIEAIEVLEEQTLLENSEKTKALNLLEDLVKSYSSGLSIEELKKEKGSEYAAALAKVVQEHVSGIEKARGELANKASSLEKDYTTLVGKLEEFVKTCTIEEEFQTLVANKENPEAYAAVLVGAVQKYVAGVEDIKKRTYEDSVAAVNNLRAQLNAAQEALKPYQSLGKPEELAKLINDTLASAENLVEQKNYSSAFQIYKILFSSNPKDPRIIKGLIKLHEGINDTVRVERLKAYARQQNVSLNSK